MNKNDQIEKIIKESFEKTKQMDSKSFWMMAKVSWILLALVIVGYKLFQYVSG